MAKQSKEAQKNAKAQAAYESLRPVGMPDGDNASAEAFSVASGSELGKRYTVVHAFGTHLYHCDCLAGQNGRECVHVLAAKRSVTERRERHTRESEMAYHEQQAREAKRAEESRRISSAMLARDNRPFSARFMA